MRSGRFVLCVVTLAVATANAQPASDTAAGKVLDSVEERIGALRADRDRLANDAAVARSQSRFINDDPPVLPTDIGERLAFLRREVAQLNRIEVLERRTFGRLLDLDFALRDAVRRLDAMIAGRRPIARPSRGPLARRDAMGQRLEDARTQLASAAASAAGDVEDFDARIDAFARVKRAAEDALVATERAIRDAALERASTPDARRKLIDAERRDLLRRWRGLEANRAILAADRARHEHALRDVLTTRAEGAQADSRDEGPAPLRDLEENALAQRALHETVRIRDALGLLAGDRARHQAAAARFYAAWADHCGREATETRPAASPTLPRTGATAYTARELALAAAQRARDAQTEADRENARTRRTLRLLVEDGGALADGYRRRTRRIGIDRIPPAPVAASIALPAPATDETRRTAETIANTRATRARLAIALKACTAAWRDAIERGLAAAGTIANGDAPAYDEARRTLAAASAEIAARGAESARLVEQFRSADRTLVAESARLSLLIEPIAEATPTLPTRIRDRVIATLGRLPRAESLLPCAAVLLLIGLLAGRARRFRRLGLLLRFACIAAALVLVGVGLARSGVASHVLAGTSGLAAAMLVGTLPLDLFAGLGFRFSGYARPGTMVSNGEIEGRVVRRGLFRSTVAIERADGARIVDIGNALLARRIEPPRRAEPERAARPAAPQVEARLTIDSDWMAVRRLIERIAGRFQPNAPVHLDVDARTIRVRIDLPPGYDAEPLRRRLEHAVAQAPFARLAEAPCIRACDDTDSA